MKAKATLLATLLWSSFLVTLASAQSASVACQNSFGHVSIRSGQCMYGETLVAVGSPREPSSGFGSGQAKLACQNSFGQVSVRSGSCMYGETLVRVIGD